MQLGVINFSEKHANIGTLFWATVHSILYNPNPMYACDLIWSHLVWVGHFAELGFELGQHQPIDPCTWQCYPFCHDDLVQQRAPWLWWPLSTMSTLTPVTSLNSEHLNWSLYPFTLELALCCSPLLHVWLGIAWEHFLDFVSTKLPSHHLVRVMQ